MHKFLFRCAVSKLVLFLLSLFPLTAFATRYYVTQYGGGDHSGSSWASAWSIGNFNASRLPSGGDTVTFSGCFTSPGLPATTRTGHNGSRRTLGLTAGTLHTQPDAPRTSDP